MTTLLLLTWLQVAPAQPAVPFHLAERPAAQAPAPAQTAKPAPTPAPAQAKPAQAKPTPARRPAAPAGTTLSITVTDSVGAVLDGVTVSLIGSTDRSGETSPEGQLRLLNVPAGTHRVRFEREGYYTFEREVIWRAGQPAPSLTVTLNAAPPPPEPPPPPDPPAPEFVLPPPSAPKTLALPDFIERNFIGTRETQKEDLVGCSGVGQAVVLQIREPVSGRQHTGADAMLYVIGGEGTLRLGESDITVSAGGFAVVPRGTTYGFTRRGRNPMIVLTFLSGPPCAGG